MPAKRTSRPRASAALLPTAATVSAAVAGAARRRAAARASAPAASRSAKPAKAAPTKAAPAQAAPTKPAASGKAAPARRSKAAASKSRAVTKAAADASSRRQVRKVLDKGVGKADQLLESGMKWVVKLAIRAKAVYDMLHAWWNGKAEFPTGTLQAMAVGLLYFISPLDLIPDVLPLFGLMDDAAVFAFVFHRIRQDLEKYAEATGKELSDLGL